MRRALRLLLAALGSAAFGLLIVATVLYVRFLRSGPELESWHRVHLTQEYTAGTPGIDTLDDYLALEERLFAQLDREVVNHVDAEDRMPFNRYVRGSLSDPRRWPRDWNRSYVLGPDHGAAGAVLLLHGLTDSPYSLRAIGEHYAALGYRVVGLRLPGHGTAPSGLLDFRIEDMRSAVRLAMRDLRGQVGPVRPVHIVGYSNGAALAIDYALDQRETPEALPRPGRLVLISPAIGISRLAAVARIRTGLSSVPGLERAAWQLVETEFDPFKYSSFTFNAAGETQRLTSGMARRISRLAKNGPLEGFPPVIAFISTVDATVRIEAVTDALLDHLAPQGHELVLFDLNRQAGVQSLLVRDPGPLTQRLLSMPVRPYSLSVVTNVNARTMQVKELSSAAGSSERSARLLGVEWPPGVFSLSHVSLPFAPDDPLYGYLAPPRKDLLRLGLVEVRGENGVIALPSWLLTRQRSNPFHAYLLQRIDQFIAPAPSSPRAASAAPAVLPAVPAPAGRPPST